MVYRLRDKSKENRTISKSAGLIVKLGASHLLGDRQVDMTKKGISAGTVHKIPADLRKVFTADRAVLAKWEDLTPLARNEWICWVTIVKKPQTRREHIERLCADLLKGKRRPCCWPGCPHR